jgi:hypothetical protein
MTGNTTDYSDTESRASSYGWKETKHRHPSSTSKSLSVSAPSSPARLRISHVTSDFNLDSPLSLRGKENCVGESQGSKIDEISQKDSFYSTTDISQCETDREVQL